MPEQRKHPASFKDPSGFLFERDNILYRQVNQVYKEHYDLLKSSGLYENLVTKNQLIPHEEVEPSPVLKDAYKILRPELIPFISYAWEWSFSQLKAAALATLKIQQAAIASGMTLKDATHLNIQFRKGQPVLIDTLSFEKYNADLPWVAYKQFSECFLFPLLLERYSKFPVSKCCQAYPAGIPAVVTNALLPFRSKFNLGVGLHVSLPAGLSSSQKSSGRQIRFSRKKMEQLLANLAGTIAGLTSGIGGEWQKYYHEGIKSGEYLLAKEELVKSFSEKIEFKSVLDIGSNDGYFSNLVAGKSSIVVAIDSAPYCIDHLFRDAAGKHGDNILPLVVDYAHPSPPMGFDNREHTSFLTRKHFDMVLVLAVVHHLCITNNIPLQPLASSLCTLGKMFIVEFIPYDDEKVKIISTNKEAIAAMLTRENFEEAFQPNFELIRREKIQGSKRWLYLMEAK